MSFVYKYAYFFKANTGGTGDLLMHLTKGEVLIEEQQQHPVLLTKYVMECCMDSVATVKKYIY